VQLIPTAHLFLICGKFSEEDKIKKEVKKEAKKRNKEKKKM